MIAYKHPLSAGQKKDILNALQSGGRLVIKSTRTQQGVFLGTLLASIGVPLLLNALMGKGLKADRTGTANTMSVYGPGTKSKGGRMINPYAYMSPPFVGTWNNPVGMGVKKKKRGQGPLLGKKQNRLLAFETTSFRRHYENNKKSSASLLTVSFIKERGREGGAQ